MTNPWLIALPRALAGNLKVFRDWGFSFINSFWSWVRGNLGKAVTTATSNCRKPLDGHGA